MQFLPHLGLLVSGGNTLLFSLDEKFTISIIAQTMDDAAGEALDKGAKLLGISYPGGAELEKRANLPNYVLQYRFSYRSRLSFMVL